MRWISPSFSVMTQHANIFISRPFASLASRMCCCSQPTGNQFAPDDAVVAIRHLAHHPLEQLHVVVERLVGVVEVVPAGRVRLVERPHLRGVAARSVPR